MPISLIQMTLGVSFVLIWAFIGTMILRDRQLALRHERQSQQEQAPATRPVEGPRANDGRASRQNNRRPRRNASAA